MSSILRVPPRAVPTLERAAKLTKKQRDLLLALFETDRPALSTGALERGVAEALGADLGEELAEPLLGEVFALAAYADSHGIELSIVSVALAEATELDLTTTQRANLHLLVESMLSSRAVSQLGKAIGMAQEHERLLHTARIFTEVRPVFDDVDDEPSGALITQRLRLDYFKDGKIEAIEIALTGDDIDMLREMLDRADKKAVSMIRTLNSASIDVFDLEESGSEESQ